MKRVNYLLACASITGINNGGSPIIYESTRALLAKRAKRYVYTYFSHVIYIRVRVYNIQYAMHIVTKCVNNIEYASHILLFTNNVLMLTHYLHFAI